LGKNVLIFIVVAYEIIFIIFIIPCANDGFPQVGRNESNENKTLNLLKSFFCIDLSYQIVVTKPDVDYEETHWAVLNGVHLEGAMLAYTVLKRADLRGAHLKRASLHKAKLRQVDFQTANFIEAELQEADLRQANLQNVLNLTVEQLSEVKTLFEAKLDPDLRKQIEKDYPHLLEKPKPEKEKKEE